jgi:ribosomal protein S18 acetylase RimI-like enzyme
MSENRATGVLGALAGISVFANKEATQKTQLDYVVSLSKKHYEEIGFLPKTTINEYLNKGQLWVQNENGEPCGFLVFGNGFPILRVYQVCIQYDAQRLKHGAKLIQKLVKKAVCDGYSEISCWVADDIDANLFWKEMGFQFCGQRIGGKKRNRKHNHWVFFVKSPRQKHLFLDFPVMTVAPDGIKGI